MMKRPSTFEKPDAIPWVSVDALSSTCLLPRPNHGYYTEEELDVKLTHVEPATFSDKAALDSVKTGAIPL